MRTTLVVSCVDSTGATRDCSRFIPGKVELNLIGPETTYDVGPYYTTPHESDDYIYRVCTSLSGDVPPEPTDVVLRMTLKDVEDNILHVFDSYFQTENRCDSFDLANKATNPVFEVDESTFTEPVTFSDPEAF